MKIATLVKSNFPAVYTRIRDLKLMLIHQSVNPSKVVLPSGQSIFVDWHEPRGHAILYSQGKGQPYVKNLWEKVLSNFTPDIILDCGANYGELIFSSNYSEQQLAYAIEADPSLVKWLNKSHLIHPGKARIQVVNALLGEESGTNQTFYVDNKWSGRSTALENHGFKDFYTVDIPTISIDDMLAKVELKDKGVFFKIDVEGYEPYVMQGMQRLLNKSKWQIGIIEFNMDFFDKRKVATNDYVDLLNQHFNIALIGGKSIAKIEKLNLKELKEQKIKFNDILVYSKHISEKVNNILKS